jgi:hypothetical protein
MPSVALKPKSNLVLARVQVLKLTKLVHHPPRKLCSLWQAQLELPKIHKTLMIHESVYPLRLSTKPLRIQIEFLGVKLKEKHQAVSSSQHSKTAPNNEKSQKIQRVTMVGLMLDRVVEQYCEGCLNGIAKGDWKFVTDEGCL